MPLHALWTPCVARIAPRRRALNDFRRRSSGRPRPVAGLRSHQTSFLCLTATLTARYGRRAAARPSPRAGIFQRRLRAALAASSRGCVQSRQPHPSMMVYAIEWTRASRLPAGSTLARHVAVHTCFQLIPVRVSRRPDDPLTRALDRHTPQALGRTGRRGDTFPLETVVSESTGSIREAVEMLEDSTTTGS